MNIALSVSYPSAPTDEKDIWRIECYLNAIRMGGGTPTALFLDEWENRAEDAVREFDGLILSGGADLPTEWYRQQPLEGAGLDLVSPRRPNFEKTLVAQFLEARKPILGICYGLQFQNVYKGGALYQDLKLQTGTDLLHTDGAQHVVEVRRDSRLFEFIGETEFTVPSYHHQAVSEIAPGGVATAFAPDGTIEAVEWSDDPFFLGVQWHPERDPDSNATQKLMAAFVAACEMSQVSR
ncbi:putative glutamine amidotransferase [Abditibacteriota bacterium]|nr:putative glutamine amidotransferase [Abditibacteriota bacterium]